MKNLFYFVLLLLLTPYTIKILLTFPISDKIFYLFILILFIFSMLEIIDEIRGIKLKEEQEQKLQKRKTSIKNYTFPPSVELSLKYYYPLLTKSKREKVLKYLRLFFIEKLSNIHLDTPSIVLNRAWRAFSLTPEYKSFSSQFFNEDFLICKPILKDKRKIIELTNTNFLYMWSSQCYIEGIDPFFPQRVPTMFMLDESLNIADGMKFKINKTKLRELLNIKDAPPPTQLIKELEDVTPQKYLLKKLKYYLNHKGYCKHYRGETLEELLRIIHKDKSLTRMIFGRYTNIDYLIDKVLNNNSVSYGSFDNTHIDSV